METYSLDYGRHGVYEVDRVKNAPKVFVRGMGQNVNVGDNLISKQQKADLIVTDILVCRDHKGEWDNKDLSKDAYFEVLCNNTDDVKK